MEAWAKESYLTMVIYGCKCVNSMKEIIFVMEML
jgi:hypothetical protein